MLFWAFSIKLIVEGAMVKMKAIRKRHTCFVLIFVASLCLAVWVGANTAQTVFVIGAGAISAVSLILLVRQNRLLHSAILIWDNRIIVVPSALITTKEGREELNSEEIVVSTFGILIGSKVYRWGTDGIHGVKLHSALIDMEHLCLTFGDAAQTMQIELLHGIRQKESMLDAAQKLLHETGVKASITGW